MPDAENDTDLAGLVRRHQAGVWRYLRLLGSQAAEADDLTQETFLILLRREFTSVGDASTWVFLRKTARHLFLDRHRAEARSRLQLRADLIDDAWDGRVEPEGTDWLAALRDCVSRLEGRPSEAVRLFYHGGMSRADVARALGMAETGVKTLLQRTRAVLKDCMERSIT